MGRKFSKTERGDIAKTQDLIMAVVNLISLEEHLAFTAMKTGEHDFYEIARGVRKIRVSVLHDLVGEPKGELWCASKHTLAAMMRLLEAASKEEGARCERYMDAAFDLYQIFWLFKEVGKGGKRETEISEPKVKNGQRSKKGA